MVELFGKAVLPLNIVSVSVNEVQCRQIKAHDSELQIDMIIT